MNRLCIIHQIAMTHADLTAQQILDSLPERDRIDGDAHDLFAPAE